MIPLLVTTPHIICAEFASQACTLCYTVPSGKCQSRTSNDWLNSIYGLWHGLGHGHENGTPYVIATWIFLSQFIARGCRLYSHHVVVDFLQFGWPINYNCLKFLRIWTFLRAPVNGYVWSTYVQCFASAYSHQSSVSSCLSRGCLTLFIHWIELRSSCWAL